MHRMARPRIPEHEVRVRVQEGRAASELGDDRLAATRPPSSSTAARWRTAVGGLDDRPATVDSVRQLPVRGHRRAHPSNPAQYVRRPKVRAKRGPRHGSRRTGTSCSLPSASITPTPRSPAPRADRPARVGGVRDHVEDLGFQRGHRVAHPRQGQQSALSLWRRGCPYRATSPWVRHEVPSSAATTASASTAAPRTAGCDPSAREPGWARAPTYVARRVHHGGPESGSPSTRCADRRSSRRSPHDDRL